METFTPCQFTDAAKQLFIDTKLWDRGSLHEPVKLSCDKDKVVRIKYDRFQVVTLMDQLIS